MSGPYSGLELSRQGVQRRNIGGQNVQTYMRDTNGVFGRAFQFSGMETSAWRSVKSATWGVAIGSLVDASVPKKYDDEKDPLKLGAMILFSAAWCGMMTHVLREWIDEEDAVGSGLFFTTLMASQPRLMKRVATLSETVADGEVGGFLSLKKKVGNYWSNIPSLTNASGDGFHWTFPEA